jgi:hypothetical protein
MFSKKSSTSSSRTLSGGRSGPAKASLLVSFPLPEGITSLPVKGVGYPLPPKLVPGRGPDKILKFSPGYCMKPSRSSPKSGGKFGGAGLSMPGYGREIS